MTDSDGRSRHRAARIASTCACFGMRRATRAITQLYDDALRPAGLRSTQFTLLVLLQGLGPIGMSELAERSGTDRTTLTRNMSLLEQNGWTRLEASGDGRVRLFALSDAGATVVEAALPLWERAQRRLVKVFGSDDLGALLQGLRQFEEAIAP